MTKNYVKIKINLNKAFLYIKGIFQLQIGHMIA